ncbi:MAG: Gfo/Idh/MocA family oxidoreductase [Planctomycetota bacterium]|nr:Gfo/Idh/MocA family oxidoreductase [Planctomycetota bacterium]
MDGPKETRKGRKVTRRTFLAGAGAAAALAVLPRHVLGGEGQTPPSEKINIACIGVGSQGLRVMLQFLAQPDVQVVSVCDVNKQSSDYPQWAPTEFRDSVRKLLGGGYDGWGQWLSTPAPIDLPRTSNVTGGTAGREPCRQIVDAYYAGHKPSGQYHGCAAYADFRELLEKQKDVDAAAVCTTDHWHALISIAAMKMGKHVYCQKPMTRTIYEARRMAEVARETRVATQVAVGNQASEATRQLCEWILADAIGPVRRVINWSSRPYWPQGIERPKEEQPVPEGLDWDLWLGPAPARPFNHAYLPFVWRGWHDFGAGAIGDMGCYSFDTIFRVLKLDAPTAVEATASDNCPETYPKSSTIHFEFPARGAMPPVKLSWYDGGLKPERPAELEERRKVPDEGLLFVGDKGSILCGFTGSNPVLLPQSKMKDFQPPPKTLPRSPGNEREWLDACKGGKTVPGANFEFSAGVTETIQLGNVATRVGKRLEWDKANMKAAGAPAADKIIRPEFRQGWTL